LCLFFFSSRRRHTRFSRDWSSDVCSSDLDPIRIPIFAKSSVAVPPNERPLMKRDMVKPIPATKPTPIISSQSIVLGSSEILSLQAKERRVGKECRSGWSREHVKEKSRKVD